MPTHILRKRGSSAACIFIPSGRCVAPTLLVHQDIREWPLHTGVIRCDQTIPSYVCLYIYYCAFLCCENAEFQAVFSIQFLGLKFCMPFLCPYAPPSSYN